MSYESERNSQPLNVLKAVGSVKNSVKSVTNAVTSVPNNIIHTVDSVMDGITKALQVFCVDTVGSIVFLIKLTNLPIVFCALTGMNERTIMEALYIQ